MSNLTLDGSTSFIGTEFIKLLATGSSNLATEEYVDDAIAEGGGGGAIDAYTKAETDNLLNNKLNVNNPQDIIGNLRLDPTNGNSKIILNAVAPANANDDFYCNGNGQFNGSLRVSLLTSDGDVNCDGVNADTFNSNVITNDIVFNHNDNEYMRFNATDDEIQLSKDIDVGSSKLICNTFDSGLSDVVFSLNSNEFLRFQLSDNTVRVPNTRSFLSQNIFTDLIQPLAFSNDVVFNGGNSTNDAYEEYIRLDASEETVNISKEVNASEDVVMQQTKILYLDNTANLQRYITTRRDNDQDILELVNNKATNNQIRFTNNGSTSLIVDNSFLFSERQIQGNNGLKVDFIDTRNTNVNFEFRRAGSTLLTLNTSNQIQLSGDLSLPTSNTQYIRFPNCNIRQGVASIVYFDFTNDTATGQYRFYIDSNTILHLRPESTTISNKLQVSTLNSSGDNDVVFQRNEVPFLTLDKFTEDTVEVEAIICSKQLRANAQIRVNNLQINQFPVGIEYADFRLENANNSIMRFFVGSPSDVNLQISQYVDGNSQLINEILLNRTTKCNGTFHTNTIDTYMDTDLLIKRNGTDVINIFTYSPTNGPSIIVDAQSDCGISSNWLFANVFANRSGDSDTEFRGAISGGLNSGKVYMTYKHVSETLDFDCIIDNTGQNVIGNLINTAVSDKNLKTNIQDIDANYSDCVKNVKLKTFEFKDEKYHNQDKYGMIAQDLLEHLPKEFKGIVRENKPKKDGDKEYLSIDYMKLSVVLWRCLQEEMKKREHIESRLFELEDIVKELKGKKPTKPKAKAKSKTKVEK